MRPRRILVFLDDDPGAPFPDTRNALDEPNGLLAVGGGLEPERLLRAYRQGIFPWYPEHSEHVLWWSPAPRCVIFPPRVHLSRRTRRRFNSGRYTLSLNRAFGEVIRACAAPRAGEPGTWITPEMERSYTLLHEKGHAHSLEVWLDGELAGGIYGLAMGAVFFGESMFSRATDGSKIALSKIALVALSPACQTRNRSARLPGRQSASLLHGRRGPAARAVRIAAGATAGRIGPLCC